VKILYHHRTRAGDAQGIHISEIQRAFRLRGHDVREVALVEAGAEAKADESGGEARGLAGIASRAAARLPLPAKEAMELAYNAVAYRRLSKAIRDFRPDFVYERYAANTFAGLAAARRHGVPFVLEVNSPLALEKELHDGLFFRGVTRRIERWLCSGADVTIAVTGVLALLAVGFAAWRWWPASTPDALAVESVSTTLDPADGAGTCPSASYRVGAVVTTNGGPGTLAFSWELPDGRAAGANSVAVKEGQQQVELSLSFDQTGDAAVSGAPVLVITAPDARRVSAPPVAYTC